MKNIILSVVVILIVIPSVSIGAERESIFGGKELHHGGFGGPTLKVGSINGELNTISGGKGAWLVNHQFYLGGGVHGVSDSIANTDYGMGYVGPMVGYIGMPHKLVHYAFELWLSVGDLVRDNSSNNDFDIEDDVIVVVEPAMYVSLNLVSFATVNAGVSYRYVSGSTTAGLEDNKLSGLTAEVNIMFGSF